MSARPASILVLSLLPACVGLTPEAVEPTDDRADTRVRPAVPEPDGDDTGPSGDDTAGGGTAGDDTAGGGTAGGDTAGEPDPGDTGSPDSGGSADNPLAGLRFWVDPDSNAAQEAASASGADVDLWHKIADHSVAKWLGGWSGDVESTVRDVVDAAEADGSVMALVVYNLPNRDCGGYSSGGAADRAEYEGWIDGIASGIGGRTAVVVLEPDGLSMMDCLSSSETDDRFAMLAYATETLTAAGAFVYIDAGHSAWHPARDMADLLVQAGVDRAAGFALNTSNYETTVNLVAYGEVISEYTGGAHFVGDTSRNGLGPTASHEWCNPEGRALGLPPSTDSGNALVDALLWVKAPGESDGSCNGGPAAGDWWPEYAQGLAERADW